MAQVFSGYIKAGAGFTAPVPFDGPSGWTVCKNGQTEIYQIRHNLHLTNPGKQLHITVTSMNALVVPSVQSSADAFVITTLRGDSGAAAETDLMFVAVYYPA